MPLVFVKPWYDKSSVELNAALAKLRCYEFYCRSKGVGEASACKKDADDPNRDGVEGVMETPNV